MTGLEIIPLPAGTIIRSNDGRQALTVQPGQLVAKGQKLFGVREDFERMATLINQQFDWSKDNG